MAQLGFAAGGALAGGAIGGGTGAQFGWGAGRFVASLIFGEDNPDIVQHGPRVQGNAVTTSAYGVMRPLSWGKIPVAGNIIDRSERRETRHEQKEKSGGKAFGPSQTVTTVTYTYDIDLCLGLGVGPSPDDDPANISVTLLQLFANNELIYDNTPGSRFVKPDWLQLKFYTGAYDEQPDPTLEAIWGVGNVPAYLGEMKIVLTSFPLDAYNGQVPSFKAIILRKSSNVPIYNIIETPQTQARGGDLIMHPVTSTMFRAITGPVGATETLHVEVFDPFTNLVVTTLECPQVAGFPLDTVTQSFRSVGFCSIPITIAGEPTVSPGPNRHLYVFTRYYDTVGADYGLALFIFDAHTYDYLGQFAVADDDLVLGGGFRHTDAYPFFPDEGSGRAVYYVRGVTNDEVGLANYEMVLSAGNLQGASSQVWDFRAVARRLGVSYEAISLYGPRTSAHNAQGTDKQGTIYGVLAAFDQQNPAVGLALLRVDNQGNMAVLDISSAIGFGVATSFHSAVIWDSTTQGIWITGDRFNDSSQATWLQYDFDLNLINSWFPTAGTSNDIPEEFEGSYRRVFDPSSGTIWSGNSSTADIIANQDYIYGVNTSTLSVTPWLPVVDVAIGGTRNTHGIVFCPTTQSVYLSDGSENNTWQIQEHKPFNPQEGTTFLSEPVYDISKLVQVPDLQINVSELATIPIDGFQLIAQGSARKAISQLAVAYLFDMIDTGEQAYFKLRTDTVDGHIPYTDMGVYTGNPRVGGSSVPEWDTWDVMEEELPIRVEITYFNKDFNYEVGIQAAGSQEIKGVNIIRRDLSVVMDDNTAKRLADVVLHLMHIERRKVKIVVLGKWLQFTAGDVITAEHRDWDSGQIKSMTMRIDKQSFAEGAVQLEGVRQSDGIFTSFAQGESSLAYDPTIPYSGVMFVDFLDIPLIREVDNDPGFYVTARGSVAGWRGGNIYKTTDDGVTWGLAASFTGSNIIGSVTTILPAPHNPWMWDEVNKFTVTLLGGGELTSSTRETILAGGANYCVIGPPGRREVVAFVNATLVGVDTYECSTLLRARLGTEWVVDLHTAGENFALLDSATLDYITATQADINVPSTYRAVSNGNSLFGAEANDYTFVNTGVCLLPYAPTQLRTVKEIDYDIVFYWRERTRLPQSVFWAATPSESPESYELDIIDPDTSTVVRTIPAVTTQAPYSRADQITDFGDIDKLITLKLYQISSVMGRGYANTQQIWLKDEPLPPHAYPTLIEALNPTAWYKCDDTDNNGPVADAQATPANITYQSGVRMVTQQSGALSDGTPAIRFPGTINTIEYSTATTPKFNVQTVSVVFLLKIEQMGTLNNVQQTIFRFTDNVNYNNYGNLTLRPELSSGRFIGRFNRGAYFESCGGVVTNDEQGPIFALDTWYQIAMVWDEVTGYKYWVDDTIYATDPLVPFNCDNKDMIINMETVFNSFDAVVQHLQIYAGTALTDQQVLDLHAARLT